MVWNQPGNNDGQDKDPWGSGGNNDSRSNQKKNKQRNSPLNDLMKELNELFGSNKNRGNDSKITSIKGPSVTAIITIIVVIVVVIWVISGIYTVREGEQGVVTRFGKLQPELVQSGLNWNPTFIDNVIPVNTTRIREVGTSGAMLTSDENLVHVEMNVQYRISNPQEYLYNVVNAEDSLRQATDSALRAVIGNSMMDKILTEGRMEIRDETKAELIKTIAPYKTGIEIQDVNFQAARPPEEVKQAFDDAIAAREDEQRFIRISEAYENDVIPRAKGDAAQIIAAANAYKERVTLEAEGDIARLNQLLPEYKKSPELTRERLYLDTMEKVLSETNKVLIDEKGHNLMVLPLDQLLKSSEQAKNNIDSSLMNSETSVNNKIDPSTFPLKSSVQNTIINNNSAPIQNRNASVLEQRTLDAYRVGAGR